ncbi:hypothetical protein F5876DRAFT_52621, partial [Lentinula aff. lateritia]
QLARKDSKLREANEKLRESRCRAVEDMAKLVGFQWDFKDYEVGMYVWLCESAIDKIKGDKRMWTYSGPYIIHKRCDHDAFVLKELSSVILPGHVNIRQLHLFYYRPDHQNLKAKIPLPHQTLSSIAADLPSFRLNRTLEQSREYFCSYPAEFRKDYS